MNVTIASTVASWVLVGMTFPASPAIANGYYIVGQQVSLSAPDTRIVTGKTGESIETRIDKICADPESFEEGEAAPNSKAMSELKQIVRSAESEIVVPMGDVSPYYGELSVTWRNGRKMLRVTTFSGPERPRLDYGTTPEGTLGEYSAIQNADGTSLVDRLRWLSLPDTLETSGV